MRATDGVEDDLDLGVRLLEAAIDCIAGCECWQGPPGFRWDDPERVRKAIERLGPEAPEVRAALRRLLALSDEEAQRWRLPLRQRVHGASVGPADGYDPREFFARAATVAMEAAAS